MVKRFQSLRHVQPDLDILFVKLAAKKGIASETHPLHTMPQELGIS